MRKSEKDKRALQDDGPVYLTKAGIEKLKRTIKKIESELPDAISELARTREMGDLSENAAYQQAKHQVRRMQAKLFHLKERLKNTIEIEKSTSDTVELGSTVRVSINNQERTFEIVGPLESDPTKGRISHVSPLGQALDGHRVADEVTFSSPAGEQIYKILEIT